MDVAHSVVTEDEEIHFGVVLLCQFQQTEDLILIPAESLVDRRAGLPPGVEKPVDLWEIEEDYIVPFFAEEFLDGRDILLFRSPPRKGGILEL
jgi:hypothetical protein